jgi:hypothetical protein
MSNGGHVNLVISKWYQALILWICFGFSSRHMEVKCEEASAFVKLVLTCALRGEIAAAWTGTLAVWREVSCEETDCTVYATTLTIVLPKQKHSLWYVSA